MNQDQNLTDLDERGRAAAHDLRARAGRRPAPPFDPERAPTVPLATNDSGRPTSPLRQPWLAAAAIVAVALLATGLWVGTRGDDNDDQADQVISGTIQPYLPTVVPDGMSLAGVAESDGEDPWGSQEGWGPLLAFGPVPDDPRIGVTVVRDGFSAEADGTPSGRAVSVGDRTGYLAEDDALGVPSVEVPANEEGDGPSLIVFGPGADEETLVKVAAGTTVSGLVATVAPDALPSGWALLYSEPDGLMALSPLATVRGASSAKTMIGFYTEPLMERTLGVTSTATKNDGLVYLQRLAMTSVETTTVRGHTAVLGTSSTHSDRGELWLWTVRWSERPGEVIAVEGIGMTRDEVIAAAESLEPVEPGRWNELVEATKLGDLQPDRSGDGPSVELGRGQFADGTAWVLRYRSQATGEDGSISGETLDLTVALSGDSSSGESSSGFGTAIGEGGEVVEQPPEVFRLVNTTEKVGRAFSAGLVSDDVARVEVRRADGTVVGDAEVIRAEVIRAEGVVAWVVELTADATTLVAFDADDTELATTEAPRYRNDEFHPVGEPIPGSGPTTTSGGG